LCRLFLWHADQRRYTRRRPGNHASRCGGFGLGVCGDFLYHKGVRKSIGRMPGDEQSILRFEDVTVTLDETKVLDGITFEMHKTDTCVILGAAGSGKTVLLKTAIGLIKPSAG